DAAPAGTMAIAMLPPTEAAVTSAPIETPSASAPAEAVSASPAADTASASTPAESAPVLAMLPPEALSDETAAPAPPDAATPEPERDEPLSLVEALDECAAPEVCADQFLWAVYLRTPKVDTVKVSEKKKVTLKVKGKTRTVTKTTTKAVDENFA